MGSKTLFKLSATALFVAVINPEQVGRFYACSFENTIFILNWFHILQYIMVPKMFGVCSTLKVQRNMCICIHKNIINKYFILYKYFIIYYIIYYTILYNILWIFYFANHV